MRMCRFAIVPTTVLIAVSVLGVTAESRSAFWKLENERCKIEVQPGPAPKDVTVKVDCDEYDIKLDAEGTNADGTPTHVEFSAKFDGKDYPIIGTYADTVSVKRIDANTMQAI